MNRDHLTPLASAGTNGTGGTKPENTGSQVVPLAESGPGSPGPLKAGKVLFGPGGPDAETGTGTDKSRLEQGRVPVVPTVSTENRVSGSVRDLDQRSGLAARILARLNLGAEKGGRGVKTLKTIQGERERPRVASSSAGGLQTRRQVHWEAPRGRSTPPHPPGQPPCEADPPYSCDLDGAARYCRDYCRPSYAGPHPWGLNPTDWIEASPQTEPAAPSTLPAPNFLAPCPADVGKIRETVKTWPQSFAQTWGELVVSAMVAGRDQHEAERLAFQPLAEDAPRWARESGEAPGPWPPTPYPDLMQEDVNARTAHVQNRRRKTENP